MRAVVQRVREARVEVDATVVGAIDQGLLIFLGAGQDDDSDDLDYLVNKIVGLRVFPDAEGRMNLSVADIGGAILVVSQFTLYGDCRKGRRPSFVSALEPGAAERLYESFLARIAQSLGAVESGRFGADMQVHLINDGPVTLLLDSKRAF